MPSTPSVRRGFALIGGPVLAVLFATAVTAGPEGPRHAHGTFVDASGSAIGSLHLTQDARGVVHVNVQVQGLSPGLHGIHIHAVGSCVAPTFASAGGHYNPLAHQHGLENPNGPHAGDLPNLIVNETGHGRLQATDRPRHPDRGDRHAPRRRRIRIHHPRQPGRPGHGRRQRWERGAHRVCRDRAR